jgi:hypothetical protein
MNEEQLNIVISTTNKKHRFHRRNGNGVDSMLPTLRA